MLSIAVLEDNINLRHSIEAYCELIGKYEIICSVGSYKEFVQHVFVKSPDFILLDIHLPDAIGVNLIADLKSRHRDSQIIIMTGDADKDFLLKAFENGASSYIYKPFKTTALNNVIEQVHETGSFLEPEVLTKLLSLINSSKNEKTPELKFLGVHELTKRETELLTLIKKGHTYKEMACLLNISFHTVNHHLKNLYLKVDVKSKIELLSKYV